MSTSNFSSYVFRKSSKRSEQNRVLVDVVVLQFLAIIKFDISQKESLNIRTSLKTLSKDHQCYHVDY